MVSKDFLQKFEQKLDQMFTAQKTKNYIYALLDLDQVKIAKDILAYEEWLNFVPDKAKQADFLIPMEGLVLVVLAAQTAVIQNNLYLSAVRENFWPEPQFSAKLAQDANAFIFDLFDLKRKLSEESLKEFLKYEFRKKQSEEKLKNLAQTNM